MPDMPIDLGKSYPLESALPSSSKDEKHYPSLYLEWNSDYDLPESGTMTVKFKKTSETNTKREDEMHQTVNLDILSIESVKGGKSETPEEDAGDVLDKLRQESEDAYEE